VIIREIELENFRGFERASIETRPLTVLLGANSSGKSSFGHALAAMAHAQWSQVASSRATLTATPNESDSWPVDLGSLDDLLHYGASGPVRIGLRTSEGWVKWGFGEDPSSRDRANLSISQIEIPSSGNRGSVSIAVPEASHPTSAQPVAASGSQYVGSMPTPEDHTIYTRLGPIEWYGGAERENVQINFEGLVPNSILHLGGTAVLFNNVARNEVLSTLGNLSYLRATRTRPLRAYGSVIPPIRQVIGYSGEWTAAVLNGRSEDPLRIAIPPDDGKQLKGAAWGERSFLVESAVDYWLGRLGLATSVRSVPRPDDPSRLQIRIEVNKGQPHDITEVGFGVSQVLPVLIAGLLQPSDGLLIVDLPEAHLHPRPQADLADFFCSLALSGKTSLVETHSEMFINQLRLRVALNPVLSDQIAIYFIDHPDAQGCCAQPTRIKIGRNDELRWPSGFMQEGWEIETRIQMAFEQREKSGE